MNLYKKYSFGKNVIVNLKTDKAFKGILIDENNYFIILKNSELIEKNIESVNVAGSILIEKNNIDFIQILGV